MKAHLAKVFTRLAQHHVAKAKHHGELAKLHKKLSEFHKGMDGEEDDPATIHKNISAAHSAASEEHVAMGESCAQCAKAFTATGKAVDLGGDLEPFPEGFSRVAPDAPPNIRAVLRPGMQALPRPDVPAGFQKLVSVEDGEEE